MGFNEAVPSSTRRKLSNGKNLPLLNVWVDKKSHVVSRVHRGRRGQGRIYLHRHLIGLKLAKPLGDKESYEFIVDNGWFCFKIQIKTTSMLASRTSYHVTAGRGADQSSTAIAGIFCWTPVGAKL